MPGPAPYKPPWYPNQDPAHNPWAVADSMTGKNHYQQWADALPPGELPRLIAEHQKQAGYEMPVKPVEEPSAPEVPEPVPEEPLPVYDGTQVGMTAVACPHCDYSGFADRMDAHLARHAQIDPGDTVAVDVRRAAE